MFRLIDEAKDYESGVKELTAAYGVSFSEDISVYVKKAEKNLCSLKFSSDRAVITCSGPSGFYRMFSKLEQCVFEGKSKACVRENCPFELFGVMLDCSRNSVLTVDSVKKYIRFLASVGMNMLMLYTEDTYEIGEYPYFGAYRGRYSKEELKAIDDYAYMFGIEVIPCIQTLAHLKTALKWPAFSDISDTEDILLVGEEKTYRFIEAAVRSVSESFRSRRVHVGMDEAHSIGLGKYLKKNGYKKSGELIREHLERVQKICEGYGLETIMWSDMFFRVLSPTNQYYEIPEGVKTFDFSFSDKCHLTYWDYYHTDYEHYKRFLNLHLDADKDCYFAGGGWTWNGICPNFAKAFGASEPAVRACRDTGVKNVFCTMWQDNGSETSQSAGYPSVAYFADLGYGADITDKDAFSDRILFLTGLEFKAYELMDRLERAYGDETPDSSFTPTKYALYEDPMYGMYASHIDAAGFENHFKEVAGELAALTKKNELTEFYRELAMTLSIKAGISSRIKEAYDKKDKKALEETARVKIRACILHMEETARLREEIWLSESKPFGYEILDIRFAGVITRLKYAAKRIEDYLSGKITEIPELDETRLPRIPGYEGKGLRVNRWDQIVSACNVSGI